MTAAVGQLSSVKFGYTDSIPNSPEYSPEKCQALLAEAGYPGGDGLPPIEYLTSQGFYPKTKEYGEVITALLQEQGFPVQLTVMEVASWIERVLTRDETAPQLADTGWMTGSPEPNLVLQADVAFGRADPDQLRQRRRRCGDREAAADHRRRCAVVRRSRTS